MAPLLAAIELCRAHVKLVYDQHDNRAWAHWQENREGERVGRPITYQDLVKRTGMDLLPGLGL